MCTSLSTSWQRRSWPDIRDRAQFSKEKKALCNTVYSAVIDRFSQETATQALKDFDVKVFQDKLTHVKELDSRVSEINEALSRIGFIDLERKEPKWRDPYNLEVKKAPSDALYHLLSKAKEEDIEKALKYLRMPLCLITLSASKFILKDRATVHLPRSTFRFFHDGLRGIFPKKSGAVGDGYFSTVNLVTIGEGSQFVYKAANKQKGSLGFLYNEGLALMRLKHESIIPIEAIDGGIYLPKADEDLSKIPKPISEGALKTCFQSIAEAMSYIHSLGMKHGDLKLANVLFKKVDSGAVEVFICDFGFIARAEDENDNGTLNYEAPELFKETKQYSEKTDVWAMGVLMVFLIMNHHPFFYINNREITDVVSLKKEAIARLGKPWAIKFYKYLQGCSESKKKLLKIAVLCLHGNPKKREPAEQIAVDLEKMSI